MRAVLVAGTVSGVGKTSVSSGLMGVLSRRGLKVQPFKTGPDYIDPGYHTTASGRASRNLDTWMLSRAAVLELFHRAARGCDIAVIEGVMGLYDGRSATGDEGSTAELAKMLDVPILLVVDSRKGARSLAALVKGYRDFDPGLNLAGVILNGTGSPRHLEICRQAIEHYTSVPVVGHLPRHPGLSIPERHLGLTPTVERDDGAGFLDRLVSACEASLETNAILKIAETAHIPAAIPTLFPGQTVAKAARIAVARDRAFSFYYADSLDLLEAVGAELAFFSPIADQRLPDGISGIYIGGGFPELYAGELSGNTAMTGAVRHAAGHGMPIYAECGGLMYLSQSLSDMQGSEFPMAGLLPARVHIDKPRLSLGYRTVEALSDGPMLRRGQEVRGHEFHWSILSGGSAGTNAYRVTETNQTEGFRQGSILASYIHLHLAALPGMAQRFVESCQSWRAGISDAQKDV